MTIGQQNCRLFALATSDQNLSGRVQVADVDDEKKDAWPSPVVLILLDCLSIL